MNEKKVKIIGCGGSGSNTISKIFKLNLDNVETCIVNSDSASLRLSSAHNKILIGDTGFGCGGDADKARQIISKDIDKIKNVVKDSKAIILTTGMGGTTGSVSICEISKVAKELNVPTIAVVTKPFKVEGNNRIDIAIKEIEELKKYTNYVFVIKNDNIYKLVKNETSYEKLFDHIDDILKITIEEINNIINSSKNGINLDLEDLKNIGKESFVNLRLGIGQTIKESIDNAFDNKIFKDCDFNKVKDILVNISFEKDSKITIKDTTEIHNIIKEIFPNCVSVKIGNIVNINLKYKNRVLIMFS